MRSRVNVLEPPRGAGRRRALGATDAKGRELATGGPGIVTWARFEWEKMCHGVLTGPGVLC